MTNLIQALEVEMYTESLVRIFGRTEAEDYMKLLKGGADPNELFKNTSLLFYKGHNSAIKWVTKELDEGHDENDVLKKISEYRMKLKSMHKGQRMWACQLTFRSGNNSGMMVARNTILRIIDDRFRENYFNNQDVR